MWPRSRAPSAAMVGSGRNSSTRAPAMAVHAFPKDLTALVRTAREAKSPLTLVEQVDKVNTDRKIAMVGRVEEAAGGSVRDKTIAVLGVTFKPNTDDMREAPSLVMLPLLLAKGARIRAYDPQGRSKGKELLPDVEWCNSVLEAAQGADVLVILTEWNEFRAVDLKQVRTVMRRNVLVDLRNVYHPASAENAGFIYRGIGRRSAGKGLNGARNRAAKPASCETATLIAERADQVL